MKKILYLLALATIMVSNAKAQRNDRKLPVVGKQCPDFRLDDVQYYAKRQVSLDDFKGQWLILDFWNRTCVNCLKAMPKMNHLQSLYKDQLQIIMVAYTGSQYRPMTKEPDDKLVRKLYEMNRKDQGLKLTVAYDSTLFHQFDVGGCPYLVIINPEGKVKAITTWIDKSRIDSLRNNMEVHLKKAYNRTEVREARLKEKVEMKPFKQ